MPRKQKIENHIKKRMLLSSIREERKFENRKERYKILICCEGTATEPNYFMAFENSLPKGIITIEIIGLAKDPINVVKECIKRNSVKNDNAIEYKSVWAVFDKDDVLDKDFNEAINLAKKTQIKVAYSNQAFELWFILHFNLHQNACNRDDYENLLSQKEYLNEKYKKNDPGIYSKLIKKGNQKRAIENAKKLHLNCDDNKYSSHDPCTTVYLLVEELNSFMPET